LWEKRYNKREKEGLSVQLHKGEKKTRYFLPRKKKVARGEGREFEYAMEGEKRNTMTKKGTRKGQFPMPKLLLGGDRLISVTGVRGRE